MRLTGPILSLALLAAALLATGSPWAGAASESVNVTFDVQSATVLDATSCATGAAGVTTLQALPGSPVVSAQDCIVDFGSTSNTAAVQMYQEDGTGTALAGPGDRTDTWTSLTTGTPQHLRALTALPDGRIWASGYNATLIYSADGGNNWTPQVNPADDTLRDLHAVDGNVIWGTGWSGNIIRTVDGGVNWTQVGKNAPINTADVRGGVRALDDQTAWVGASGGRVFKTVDGGASWTTLTTGAPSLFWGMALVGTSELWVVGDSGQIVHTLNGGTTWTVERNNPTQLLKRVDALDSMHAIAAGDGGLVVATADGGATWTDVPTPTVQDLDGIRMFTAQHWLVVGYNGTILETRNAGTSWDVLPSGTTNDLRALWAPDSTSIWTVGQGGTALRAPVTPIDDYDDALNHDFGTAGAGFFGACLSAAELGAGTNGTTWTPGAGCPASDGAWWNGIPQTSASPDITIAKTAAPTPMGSPARVRLRFGARPPADAAPGSYRARLVVAVIAPG
jgi:photosystem II stability/assembly factor-like uncharacterized protein